MTGGADIVRIRSRGKEGEEGGKKRDEVERERERERE